MPDSLRSKVNAVPSQPRMNTAEGAELVATESQPTGSLAARVALTPYSVKVAHGEPLFTPSFQPAGNPGVAC
ncbi:unannotated protein [freshwater metagenome]|uniref:Unannotated protein n=1 Tax=freshwater metagenome TaxID=449393 RepID=A0A6J7IAP0_9ZZZZ